jgi:hypothetical protein
MTKHTLMVKQHNSKEVKKLFKNLKLLGFTVIRKTSGAYRIDPPPTSKNRDSYYTHGTESSIHYICRDFKRLYDIDIKG